jgi:serine/threonine protein kinase
MFNPALTWAQRLLLVIESARALVYLHRLSPPVVHRDIKSSNILIDDRFHAKVLPHHAEGG